MGRELRRKEAKKNKNNIKLKEEELDTSINGITLAKIVIFGLIILLVLYYIVAVFITKEIDISNKKETTQEQTNNTSSNKILASNIFNQKEDTYYVYFYDFNEEDSNINNAISSKADLTFYRVDTSSALNKKYVTEAAGNRNVTGIDNLSVKNPTIIGITNDTVTAYYEGGSEIITFLGN